MHPTAFGKYQVVELIGEGGFGRVFKGMDPDLKRPVAIKTCSLTEPEMRERFFREAEIAAKLSHPNITTVFDFGREEGEPYLVQEYLTGRDLDDVIRDGPHLPLATKIEYLVQVAEGLAHAHAHGVVHRDVKPANIRILDDGQVRIMDFGIARLMEETQRFTQAGMSIGTAGYLSPEQLQGMDVDHRSDIFSFGVLAYELVLNRSPFRGDSISALFYAIAHQEPEPVQEVWPECPPALSFCISRCLEKDREARYRDFGEVTAELRHVLAEAQGEVGEAWSAPAGGLAGVAGGESPGEPEPRPPGRKKWLLPLWGIVAVALVLALFEVLRFAGRGESSSGGEVGVTPLPMDTSATQAAGSDAAPAPGEEVVEASPDPAREAGSVGARDSSGSTPSGVSPEGQGTPVATEDAPETREAPPSPFRGSATLVLFFSVGGDPAGVTSAENAFLEELSRRRLQVVDAGLLAGIHDDAAAMAAAQGMDARAIAGMGRTYDAEIVVVGSLRTEATPSAGQFYTGRAVLDVRTYRASTAELLGSETYQVGTGNTPGELGPSLLAAEGEAAREVGRRAAVGIAREYGDAMPSRR
jgi:predicted Ser/Thr protein kinase